MFKLLFNNIFKIINLKLLVKRLSAGKGKSGWQGYETYLRHTNSWAKGQPHENKQVNTHPHMFKKELKQKKMY